MMIPEMTLADLSREKKEEDDTLAIKSVLTNRYNDSKRT